RHVLQFPATAAVSVGTQPPSQLFHQYVGTPEIQTETVRFAELPERMEPLRRILRSGVVYSRERSAGHARQSPGTEQTGGECRVGGIHTVAAARIPYRIVRLRRCRIPRIRPERVPQRL